MNDQRSLLPPPPIHYFLSKRANVRANRFFFLQTSNVIFKGCGATKVSTSNDEGLEFNNKQRHHVLVRRTGRNAVIRVNDVWIGDDICF